MLNKTAISFSHVKPGTRFSKEKGCATSSCTATWASPRPPAARYSRNSSSAERTRKRHRLALSRGGFPYRDHAARLGALHVRGPGNAGQAGDCVHQRPGIVHYLFDYSPDMEYLEVVGPADFTSIESSRCAVPDAEACGDKWRLSRTSVGLSRPQNSMSSSSISSGSSFAAAIHSSSSGIAMMCAQYGRALRRSSRRRSGSA